MELRAPPGRPSHGPPPREIRTTLRPAVTLLTSLGMSLMGDEPKLHAVANPLILPLETQPDNQVGCVDRQSVICQWQKR